MIRITATLALSFFVNLCAAQLQWKKVDSLFQPLPASVQVYFTNDNYNDKPFRAYYLIADLKDKALEFTVDTSQNRRLTPKQFYEKNGQPIAVVNTTFFSFATNQNLNLVIKDGKLVAHNVHTLPQKGKDTLTYRHPFTSAIGISKDREADVAWTFTDSAHKTAYAFQTPVVPLHDSVNGLDYATVQYKLKAPASVKKWKMQTAVGGGPVLVQKGEVKITNNEERKFGGKGINDKHPRTAMGYTADGKLVILMVEGRNANAAGATLTDEANILKDLGCVEALNLDGGGSSCLLVNGKETITPSDKVQRAVPAVFIIRKK